MSIQEVTAADFRVISGMSQTGVPTPTMTINRPGYTLVFFKAKGCVGCDAMFPVFRNISNIARKVDNFVICDVTQHRSVITMSRDTKVPIQAVPLLILYYDGKPYAKYTGQTSQDEISRFIDKAAEARPQSTFMQPASHQSHVQQSASHQSHVQQPHFQQPHIQGGHTNQHGVRKTLGQIPAYSGGIEEPEDENRNRLEIPDQVTPHNVPWEGAYKMMN